MNITMQDKHQTRDGRAVRILATDAKSHRTIIGIVTDVAGYDHVFSWFPNGLYYDDGKPADLDLILVPTKHQAWGVVITSDPPFLYTHIFMTKEGADHWLQSDTRRGSVIHVTWES